jgi:hypothetical protein
MEPEPGIGNKGVRREGENSGEIQNQMIPYNTLKYPSHPI